MTSNETLAEATRRRPVQVTASGMLQQVCGHNGCKAQRLSRPDGQSWRPCWNWECKTDQPPKPVERP